MTREQAIRELKIRFVGEYDRQREAKDMAIKALEQEPSYNSVNSLVESKLKNPKAKTFDILHFVADNAGLSTFEAIEKAYNMGVSEQEPVLDKISAEIAEYGSIWVEYKITGRRDKDIEQLVTDVLKQAKKQVLDVIDKYKSESEDEG